MKFAVTLIFVVLACQSYACDVFNYKDAIECIKKDSYQRYDEGELPHSIGATRKKAGKKAFEKITGKKSTTTYVGVVEVHYDEDQLLYYQIPFGKNVTPKLTYDTSIADIQYDVPALEEMSEEEILKLLSLEIPLIGTMEKFHY